MQAFIILQSFSQFIHQAVNNPAMLFDPGFLIQTGGLTLLFIILFCESGVFFCFWLPGDSLVFTAGVVVATKAIHSPLSVVMGVMILAGILGNLFGYWFGKRLGNNIYEKKENLFFKQEYIIAAKNFYNKYGALALMIGRFLPVIRTFVPIVAGVLHVDFKRFFLFTVLGGALWIVPVVLAGYKLGQLPFVQNNFGTIILFIVVVITLPIIWRIIKEKRKLDQHSK